MLIKASRLTKDILKKLIKINRNDYSVLNLLIINIKKPFIVSIKKNDD